MTLEELQNICDVIADQLEAAAIPIQARYLSYERTFWQGLPTHDVIPADGNFELCLYGRAPADVALPWASSDMGAALQTNFPSLPFCLSIDVFALGEDRWWTGTMEFVWGGVRYRQVRTYNATGKTDQGEWHAIEEADYEL